MWLTPPTPDKRTFEFADRLSRIELSKDIEMFGPQIIEIMKATGADRFRTIDERPLLLQRTERPVLDAAPSPKPPELGTSPVPSPVVEAPPTAPAG